ncbi:winged helix-turn-helix domain-containing protein [Microbispora rosea]|uniref:winged helix-turn-helix domain-containing protein n=1 Tax=Microbispora rosea TaxID=58117 RepID=UPI0037AE7A15
MSYTVGGVCYLLHRLGWSWQVPCRRAAERDEKAVAVKGRAVAVTSDIAFPTALPLVHAGARRGCRGTAGRLRRANHGEHGNCLPKFPTASTSVFGHIPGLKRVAESVSLLRKGAAPLRSGKHVD